jgi:hypothetical protein
VEGDQVSEAKVFYRSSKDGELGWMVERDGRKLIQLNRPNEEVLRHYTEAEWIPEMEHRPLSKAALGRVCFESDQALCRALGIHEATQKTWLDLTDKQRIAWMTKGPTRDAARSALWQGIQMLMEPMTRG